VGWKSPLLKYYFIFSLVLGNVVRKFFKYISSICIYNDVQITIYIRINIYIDLLFFAIKHRMGIKNGTFTPWNVTIQTGMSFITILVPGKTRAGLFSPPGRSVSFTYIAIMFFCFITYSLTCVFLCYLNSLFFTQ